jgi:lysophospholipid hydrolase
MATEPVQDLADAAYTAIASPPQTSTFGLLAWVILSILRVVPSVLYYVITFTTITVPTWIYTLLSISLTVTVNFSTLAFLVIACVSTVSYLVRYRYHTYARLPAEPPRKEPEVEVFTESQSGDSKPGLSNYLDEFLSAIKVFGYLERHVDLEVQTFIY